MAYGTIKVDNIVFTNSGVDQTLEVSGIAQALSGDITSTGTVQAASLVGTTDISGAFITGNAGGFGTLTGVTGIFTTVVSGSTVSGVQASFSTGTFQRGGADGPSVRFLNDYAGLFSSASGEVSVSTAREERIRVNNEGVTYVFDTIGFLSQAIGSGTKTVLQSTSTGGNVETISLGWYLNDVTSTGIEQRIKWSWRAEGSNYLPAGYVAVGKEDIWDNAADRKTYLSFATRDVVGVEEKLRITATGQVQATFSGTSSLPIYTTTGDPDSGIYFPSADQVAISTSGTERVRIDSSGRLLVGTPASLGADYQVQVAGTTDLTSSLALHRYQDGVNCSVFGFNKSRGASVGTDAVVVSDDRIGIVNFRAYDGLSYLAAARIEARVDGTPGANSMPGRIVLSTTPSGSGTPQERLRITSDGKVGIGTTSPSERLDIANGIIRVINNTVPSSEGDGAAYFGKITGGAEISHSSFVAIRTGSSERARIDSSGRLLVGTPTSIGNNTVESINTFGLYRFVDSSAGPFLNIGKSRSATTGTNTVVLSGDSLGTIAFGGADGTSYVTSAWIRCQVDGTPAANDMPGRLVFSTTPSGSASPVERMRITSDAYVRLASGTGGIQFNNDTAAANALDDYEEGTWTPVVADAATGGNTGTTSISIGTYTKLGRLVTLNLFLQNIDTTGMTAANSLFIRGTPFAARNEAAAIIVYSGAVAANDVTVTTPITSDISDNTSYVRIRKVNSGASTSLVLISDLTSGSADIFITITYEAAS